MADRRQRRGDQRRHDVDALTGYDGDAVLLVRLEAGRRDRQAVNAGRNRDAIRTIGLRRRLRRRGPRNADPRAGERPSGGVDDLAGDRAGRRLTSLRDDAARRSSESCGRYEARCASDETEQYGKNEGSDDTHLPGEQNEIERAEAPEVRSTMQLSQHDVQGIQRLSYVSRPEDIRSRSLHEFAWP